MPVVPATFGGWAFPGIPGDARLVYIDSTTALPAAPGTVFAAGQSPLGGVGYLLSKRSLDRRGARQRVALIGGGCGLVDYSSNVAGLTSIGAGVTTNLLSLLGLAGIPTEFRQLRVEASGIGLIFRDSATGQLWGGNAGPSNSFLLQDVAVPTTWEINNPTAGALSVYVTGERRAESLRQYVTLRLCKRDMTDAGVLIGTVANSPPPGEVLPAYPDPLDQGGMPQIVPIVTTPSFAELQQGEAYGLAITLAGAVLPASASVLSRIVFAVWPEGRAS